MVSKCRTGFCSKAAESSSEPVAGSSGGAQSVPSDRSSAVVQHVGAGPMADRYPCVFSNGSSAKSVRYTHAQWRRDCGTLMDERASRFVVAPVEKRSSRCAPPVRVATRGSPLALIQTQAFIERLREICPVLHLSGSLVRHIVQTTGDRTQDRSLVDIGGKGLFAKEIHEALIEGRVDLGVHSLKDLESYLPPGIALGCVLPREDARDALVVRGELASEPRRDLYASCPRLSGRVELRSTPGSASPREA